MQTAAAVQGKLRVGGFAADAQLIDQAVAHPGSTQRVAGGNRLPAHNADRFQTVQIAFYAAAVVDDHSAAGQSQRAGKHDVAGLRGGDSLTVCGGIGQAGGLTAALAIHHLGGAVGQTDSTGAGGLEPAVP